ncbi:MAG: hypothetical protein ACE5JI_15690, partial [Acidobacteriota bacterium]
MASTDATSLAALRTELLGRKAGKLTRILRSLPKLPPEEQKQLARTMVKVSSYMANPDGLAAQELSPEGGVLAEAQADATEQTRKRLAKKQGFAG